ncbi:hypothetical protein BsWGS_24048 [Bradybaena similaris]
MNRRIEQQNQKFKWRKTRHRPRNIRRKGIVSGHEEERWREQWKTSQRGRLQHQHLKEPKFRSQVKEIMKIPINEKLWRLRLGSWKDGKDNPMCMECLEDNSRSVNN